MPRNGNSENGTKKMGDLGQLLSQRRQLHQYGSGSSAISHHQRRGRRPGKIKIFECFFPNCPKKYHPDIICFKNHLITKHLKEKIENHISKFSKVRETQDPRECPFQPCGFYASFKGGAVKHFALAHNGLQKFLAEMSEEMGLSRHFKNLVLQGVFRDASKPPEVVKCELCDHEFVKEHLKSHQILKHFLVNYSEEVTQFHTQKGAGDCPVFDCQFQADSTKAGGAKMKMLSLHFEQKHFPLSLMKRTMFASKEITIPCPFIDSLTLRPCSKRFLINNHEDLIYLSHHVFAHIPDLVSVNAHQFHELAVNANSNTVTSLEKCPLQFCKSKLCDGNPEYFHKYHATDLSVFILSTIAGPESILISSVLNLLGEFRRSCLLDILKNQVPLQIQESERILSKEDTTNTVRTVSIEISENKDIDNPENAQQDEQLEPSKTENISKSVPVPEQIGSEETRCIDERTAPVVEPSSVMLTDIAYCKKWNKTVCRSWKKFMMQQTDAYLEVHFNFLPSRPCKVPNCGFRAVNCAALMKHIRIVHSK